MPNTMNIGPLATGSGARAVPVNGTVFHDLGLESNRSPSQHGSALGKAYSRDEHDSRHSLGAAAVCCDQLGVLPGNP